MSNIGAAVRKRRKNRFTLDRAQEVLMILPMTSGFFLFSIYPIIWVLRWSVYNYNGFSEPIFTGLENFIRIFTRDPSYWAALLNTFLIAGLKMLVEIPLALLLAVAVNSRLKGNALFRVVYFMPSVFSIAVVGLIFSILSAPSTASSTRRCVRQGSSLRISAGSGINRMPSLSLSLCHSGPPSA